jgi:hypothetical protein
MASSRSHQLKIIDSIVGNKIGSILLDKIELDYGNAIKKHSDFTLRCITHGVANYIDNILDSDWGILNTFTIQEIQKMWDEYIPNYCNSYSTKNYIETNKILLDNRINNIGYYWVDLEKHYSIEMIARMGNCGRCNYEDTLIELREATPDLNKSHIVIVYNNSTGLIKQIKGVGGKLPEPVYCDELYNFYMNSSYNITGHQWQWKEYLDFKPEMFDIERYTLIKSKIINKII